LGLTAFAEDLSSATLLSIGSKTTGASFDIAITEAKDTSGTFLSGSKAVTVTATNDASVAAVVYSGDVTFTEGGANVTIPASSTPNSITTAGIYTLTVAIDGVTPQPTVSLTITGDSRSMDPTQCTVGIDQELSKGDTRAITVTLRDKFGNPIAKNFKTKVTIANNYSSINESYVVDGTTMTASGFTTTVYTNANGQYTVNVVMPGAIDPGDGIAVQIAQNNGTSFIGSPFTYYEPIATPVFSSAVTTDATHIVLTMDQPLLGTVANIGAFSIHGAATNPTITNAVVAGTNVTLTLSAAIAYGETITLDYAKTGNNDLNNGPASQVANFTNQPVTNNAPEHAAAPVFVSAASNVPGNIITVTFDKEMAVSPSAPNGFSVTVDGVNDVVTALATDKTKIILNLTTAIKFGQTVKLSYSPGTVTALDGGALAGFSDQAVDNNTIQDGYITTLLGDGTSANTGDNGPAGSATLKSVNSIKVDSMGNIYFVDGGTSVREIAAVSHTQFGINMIAGNVYTIAGNGTQTYSGDNNSALNAGIYISMGSINVDQAGNLYIAEYGNHRIREVANTNHTQFGIDMTEGYIYTIAGTGTIGYSPEHEGIAATSANLKNPKGVAIDEAGDLYIADYLNMRVRKVDVNGIITTVAGTGTSTSNCDSGEALSFNMQPVAIVLDGAGNKYISDTNKRILKMDTSGNIITYAGNKTGLDIGSAPPATNVGIPTVQSMTLDSAGNLYLAELGWNRVDRVGTDGSVTAVAGFGWMYPNLQYLPFNGDNIPATTALLGQASGVDIDDSGNLYVTDFNHFRIRFVQNANVVVVPPPVVSSATTLDETHIGLTMSRALLGSTGDPAAFVVSGVASNPTVTKVEICGTSVTLTLSSAIANNDVITLAYTKTGGSSENSYSNLTAVENFSNQPVTNTIVAPPVAITVSSADPGDGATGITIDKTVAITFSETILEGDAYNQINITDSGNNSVPFTKSISGSVLSLDPDANLSYSSTYTVTIPAGAVKNAAGSGLTNTYTLSFTTVTASTGGGGGGGGSADTDAPTWPNKTFKTATKAGDNVILEWYAATDNKGVTGYNIYHGTELIGSVDTTTFTYPTEPGSGTGSLPYSVQAVDAAGNESTDGPSKVLGGSNLPLIYEYGFYRYAPDSNTTLPDVLGELKTSSPWIVKEVPITFGNNEAIGLRFATNVAVDTYFKANQAVIKMYDASNKSVSIKVDRSGDGTNTDENRRYLFVIPQVTLKPGTTYKIIVGPTLTSNNGMQAGKEQEVSFTTSGSSATSTGSTDITTEGPTYTNGSGSVKPDVGATVGLNDMATAVIPADALKGTSSVKVNVKKVTSPPAAPAGFKIAGEVYEFSVGDKTSYSFAKKVALTFKIDASKFGADEVPAIYYYDETQKKWVNIGGTVSGSTITVQVDHFTKYTVFAIKKTEVPVEQPTIPVEQPSVTLNDIAGHWAQSNIEKLVNMGAVSGYPDGSFKPGKTISRAEFAAMLVKAFKLTASSGKSFTDTAGHWAKDAIATSAAYGIVNGYDDNTFRPNDPITREQMAAMIVNAAKLTQVSEETQFVDNGKVSAWAKKAVATAVKNGIMNGYSDNKFLPRGNATRAEAVTVIVNALK